MPIREPQRVPRRTMATARPVNFAAPKLSFPEVLRNARNTIPRFGKPAPRDGFNPFSIPFHPPGATPPRDQRMAMDDSTTWASTAWSGMVLNNALGEGLAFLGYPFLAELAQRPEYRTISEVIATEATRKWIKINGSGKDDEDETKRIKELEDELERLEVRDRFCDLAAQDGFFGRSHLFIDFGDNLDGPGTPELATSIGDGRGELSLSKVKKGSLQRLQTVEAVWTYPMAYNAQNPLRPDWYNPQQWYVMGREVHVSRLLRFIGRPVPDLLKPAYSFGGLSMSQIAQPYVNYWLQTRTSVGDIIHAFSVMVLSTDLSTLINAGGMELINRVQLFNELRDNRGLFMVNKESEEFSNVSAPLGSLDALQAQAQEHMCVQAGTLIRTDRGNIKIEEITTDDRVLTRDGLSPIKWVGVTGHRDTLIEIQAGRSVLRVTEEHPVWSETTKEFVNARNVSPSHRLLGLPSLENMGHQSLGAVDGGGKQRKAITATKKLGGFFTAQFGRRIAAQFRMATRSIIGMMTEPTTSSKISRWLPGESTWNAMVASAACLTGSTNIAALNALGGFWPPMNVHAFVPRDAKPKNSDLETDGSRLGNTTKNASAVGRVLKQNAELSRDSALAHACSVSVGRVAVLKVPLQPVYNIEVDGLPEFFANDVLVHNSSVSRIPLVKLLGISPHGMNASTEGELRAFYDTIHAYQHSFFRRNLTTVLNFVMINLWGKVDPRITFEFVPLFSLTELEEAEVDKFKAETDDILVNGCNAISPEEVRGRLAADAASPYAGLDVGDLPEPIDQGGENPDGKINLKGTETYGGGGEGDDE